MIGNRLGPYEITAKLGEGGMGEVYRATDTKLDRDVAIKVLPAAFIEDEARLNRFEREAKLLAQLHHPHIASIFGLEESEGVSALVMELVEGPTLAERLAGGPLSLEEALPIARQIALALETAHEKGIIHRDLKPQNIKLTPDGEVKVLDFGLAKAMDPGGSAAGSPMASPTMMSSPTLTAMPGTQLGVILGTAAYMAPEQARGQAVDKRADIWAFGVVLYEMLTGAKLFASETVSDTLAAVIRKEVDLDGVPNETPPTIRRLLRRCLERDPRNRLRDIGDARLELEDAHSAEVAPVRVERRHGPMLPAALAVALLLGAGLALLLAPSRAPQHPPVRARLTLTLPDEAPLAAGNFLPSFAFSPDGESLAYVALGADGIRRLAVRELDSGEVRVISGTEGSEGPFFSPDGEWIGFWSQWKIRKTRASGAGLPEVVCDSLDFRGGTWAGDLIVFAPSQTVGLFAVDHRGGTPRELTKLLPGEGGHRFPHTLPGGDTILFTAYSAPFNADRGTIAAISTATGERTDIGRGSLYVRYSGTGHLLYVQAGRLLAAPFDVESLTMTGEARALVGPVLMQRNTGATQFAVSPDGHLAWVEGGYAGDEVQLVRVDRSGARNVIIETDSIRRRPTLSPDDREFLITAIGPEVDGIWLISAGGDEQRLLTSGSFYSQWLPDRRWSYSTRDNSLIVGSVDGASPPVTVLPPSPVHPTLSGASRDGLLSYGSRDVAGGLDAWILDSQGGEPEAFLEGPDNEGGVSFSPDGRYVAYISDRSGQFEVYVSSFPDKAATWQVSTSGGSEVIWRRDGREITFRSGGDLMAVPVTTDPTFHAGTPAVLFPFPYDGVLGSPTRPNYDLARDGSWFLLIDNPDLNEPASQIQIALGWEGVFGQP